MAANESGGSWVKVTILGLLIAGCGVAMWATASSNAKGLRDETTRTEVRGQRGGGNFAPDRAQRGDGRPGEGARVMADQLDLTGEQRRELEQLRTQFESNPDRQPGGMFEAMNQILTPEQREQARSQMQERGGEFRERMQERMARREQEAREALSPAEFKEWQERMEERRGQIRERFEGRGLGGGRGPGGGANVMVDDEGRVLVDLGGQGQRGGAFASDGRGQ